MNRAIPVLLLMLIFSVASDAQTAVPFSKGVNLTGWFQASGPGQIPFNRFSENDFDDLKFLGCDVIRLPVNLHAMTSGAPDYIPDPGFLRMLDQAVDWAEARQIHLIIDNHSFDPSVNTDPGIGDVLVKVWSHMAAHFKDRSDFVYYEVLNEPHGIDDAVWGEIQQRVIDAIRAVDTKHYIVVGPASWNSYAHLKHLPAYTDARLIYTFHFYDPFVFTHQGASWVEPSMVPLAGVPFPYRASAMPATPQSLRGTWVESALNNYRNDGAEARVRQLIDEAVTFRNQRNVPIFCGEFGVYIPNSPEDDRVLWYDIVRKYLEEKGIAWTIWDYKGGFGLFEKNSPEFFDYDLNVALLEALAFAVPPQETYVQRPLTSGFVIYDDAHGEDIINASSTGGGTLDFYSTDAPQEGAHCIYWTGVGQYDPISFDFVRTLDMSLLERHGFSLSFQVRASDPSVKFDVRFIDTKRNQADHPWRKGKTIQGIPADNGWHRVNILFAEMEEKGSWDGTWYPPEGNRFEWNAVDRLEFVPEHQPLAGASFSFDHIQIEGEEFTVTSLQEDAEALHARAYPNPAKGETQVQFTLARPQRIRVELFDARGSRVKILKDGEAAGGIHHLVWDGHRGDGSPVPDGMYLLRLETEGISTCLKLLLHR